MATCGPLEVKSKSTDERRQQVMLGELPEDFLRVLPLTAEQQVSLDEQTAIALQHQYTVASAVSGRLTISIIEAKLNKNYGLTRMDPYVRLRVGNSCYETSTNYNGARNPRWYQSFNCFFIAHDRTVKLEVFDECAFSLDEKIAYGSYDIPKSVLLGKTVNEWIELSGKLGENKEGSINIVITCQPIPTGTLIYHPKSAVTVIPYGTYAGKKSARLNDHVSAQPITNPEDIDSIVTADEFKQVTEMFPTIDIEIIRAIMEGNRCNKEHTINALLELSRVT
ncbi:toll-interacting protein A [Caerostris darwini]|uniref:Toll-interacting protein A n=1 Tax=Caerostris darwini TaxID=1538125 RepID=A0AAV4QQF7_9ARAC|nr:toll-interacting protein A [Caerostris darwini]